MDKNLGTTNAKLAFVLIASIANAADAIGRETGWKQRAAELMEIVPLVRQGSKIDFKAAMAEFKDLSAAEREEVLKAFGDQFKIHDSQLEASVEKGLVAVMDLFAAGTKVYEFVKELKGDSTQVVEGTDTPAESPIDPATGEMRAGANQAAISAPKTTKA